MVMDVVRSALICDDFPADPSSFAAKTLRFRLLRLALFDRCSVKPQVLRRLLIGTGAEASVLFRATQ
ncbi:hypothetical protein DSM05_07690 [Pseudomonas sp. FW305-3-2-15-E-TSA4]|nr:hypothetical protein [Pseudomonas sp. FW305-3-2-15-E-TSA4]